MHAMNAQDFYTFSKMGVASASFTSVEATKTSVPAAPHPQDCS